MREELLQEFLERGVTALERLAQDPVIEMETGPPVCPHCEKMNPTVRVEESEGIGALGEFVIKATCTHCGNVFYAVPIQWVCAPTVQEAGNVISERAELSGFHSREDQNKTP
jgi:hypothetical protein